ncbi:hypothetical protein LSCM4_03191 [Leishmania orientalis]|uniref:Uncharacterized protein n=1 Tax=Leishmania orientalis TaxID=2249476 RepID=A0A836H752_9TRYP|nr:hypothetical protein LSCM4_03191 [Leishmania orientalis]
MSEVAHLHEMNAEVVPLAEPPAPQPERANAQVGEAPPSTEDGITIAEAPQKLPAGEDGGVASAAEPSLKVPPQRAIRPAVSASHMRISSRPSAGDTHFSNAAKTAAAASAISGRSHAVPYEGTAVCLPSRGRASQSRARAGAGGTAGGAKAAIPLAAEEADRAKAQPPQETAAAGRAATRARIRPPETRLTPGRSQKALTAYAAEAAANGSDAGSAKKASRRRLVKAKAAKTEGKRSKHPEAEVHVAIKATKSRRTVKVSKNAENSSDKPDGVEPAARLPKTVKKKTATGRPAAAEKGGEAAVAKKGSLKKAPAKKLSKVAAAADVVSSTDAATTNVANGESAEHAAAAKVEKQKHLNGAAETSDTEEEKSSVKQAGPKVEEENGAPAAEGDASAAAKHADPETMDAVEDPTE